MSRYRRQCFNGRTPFNMRVQRIRGPGMPCLGTHVALCLLLGFALSLRADDLFHGCKPEGTRPGPPNRGWREVVAFLAGRPALALKHAAPQLGRGVAWGA